MSLRMTVLSLQMMNVIILVPRTFEIKKILTTSCKMLILWRAFSLKKRMRKTFQNSTLSGSVFFSLIFFTEHHSRDSFVTICLT